MTNAAHELHPFFRAIGECPFTGLVGSRSILRGAAEVVGKGGLTKATRNEVVCLLDLFIDQTAAGAVDAEGGFDGADENLRRQFRLVMQGYGHVMKALAVAGMGIDVDPAQAAAKCFSDAWDVHTTFSQPEQRRRDSERSQQDKLFRSALDAFGANWTAGAWTVWDMVRRLRQPSAPDSEWTSHHASAPILLYDGRSRRGRLALLHVAIRQGERGDFLPCPLALGAMFGRRMTGKPDGSNLAEPPHDLDFLASMRRAWHAAGLAALPCRGRWWVTEYQSDRVRGEPIDVPYVEGRSAEAAACCALWAANGGIPGEATQRESMSLDLERPLTACLGGVNGASLRDRVLELVDELPAKIQEVQHKKLAGPVLLARHRPSQLAPELLTSVKPLEKVGAAFEQMLSFDRLKRGYQRKIEEEWRKYWQDAHAPFIADQKIKLLTEFNNPESELSTERIKRWNGPKDEKGAALPEEQRNPWSDLADRLDIVKGETPFNDILHSLQRACVTSDAGMGKSTTIAWLCWQFNLPDAHTLAISLTAKQLGNCQVADLLDSKQAASKSPLVAAVAKRLENASREEIASLLRRLRSQGALILLIDALDEVGARSKAVDRIQELSAAPDWRGCRIIVSGRPYALTMHWRKLFPNHSWSDWRFLLVDEFDVAQQTAYLGEERINAIPADARAILTVPRVLYYLRRYVSDPSRIRTASDVYWTAIRGMVHDAMLGGSADADRVPDIEKMTAQDVLQVIAALAYVMTFEKGTFDSISASPDLRKRIGQLCGVNGDKSAADWASKKLKAVASLNAILTYGFLDFGFPGNAQFRNRSLQEFFAAYWISNYCLENQVDRLWERLPLAHDAASQAWYWTFRFAAEMPDKALDATSASARSDEHWIRAMSAVFRPGDGTPTGTKRASEIIVRAWPTLHDEYCQRVKHQSAIQVVEAWRSEFQAILDSREETPRKQAAVELTQSFIDFPGGEFKMGSPAEDNERFNDEPDELLLKLAPFSLCRFLMLNSFYRLYDPGHGLAERSYDPKYPYSRVSPGERHPTIYTSWWDARAASLWFRWRDSKSNGGWLETTLPNEAQHEYVARRGQKTYQEYWWGRGFSDKHCHGRQNFNTGGTAELPRWEEGMNHPRLCQAGVYDITGNVWTWCLNVFRNSVGSLEDVTALDGGPLRSVRGACWGIQPPGGFRSAFRNWLEPGVRRYRLGFRLALVRSG